MKVFLTGASGFIGNQILLRLLADGHEVTVLVHSRAVEPIPGFTFREVRGHLTDPEELTHLMAGHEAVIHSAGLISFRKRDKARLFETNTMGTRSVVLACKLSGVKRLIHVGTVAALGASPVHGFYKPTYPYNLKSLRVNYSITKYLADQEVMRGFYEGLETIILSPGNVIGPGDIHRSNLSHFKAGRAPLPVSPAGGVSVVDVRDVADVSVMALTGGVPGSRYVLSAETTTYAGYLDLIGGRRGRVILPRWLNLALGYGAELISSVTGLRLPLTIEKGRLSGYYFWFDGSETARTFQFTYRPIRISVKDSLDWYMKQGVLS